MDFEVKIKKFYESVIETWSEIDKFVGKCDSFQRDWRFEYSSVEICKSVCKEGKKEMDIIKSRLTNKTLKCVVIGKVSSGKSTLINALLLNKILPSGFSCRTNCFIEVKKSSKNKSYIVVEGEEKNLDLLKDLADDFSPDALPPGSLVELFFCTNNQTLFNEDMIIMDTPGFDDISELDNVIEDKCGDADVLILVVSSLVGLGETEKNFIRKHQTIFSKFNILILYSFWDKPQSENLERSFKMKTRLTQQAKEYLHKDLNIPMEDTDKRIFFVSAEEILLHNSSNEGRANWLMHGRDDEFDNFLKCLKVHLSNNSYKRRLTLIDNIDEVFKRILYEIEFFIEDLNIKKLQFCNKLLNDLSCLADFNNQINLEVNNSFKESYSQFFDKGLEVIKSDLECSEETMKERLNIIINEITVVAIESLKIRIIDLIQPNDSVLQEHCVRIVETLYLPRYFNLEREIKSFKMDLLHGCLKEINRVKKVGTGISIGGAVIGAAATVASGGILAGIILPIPTLFGAATLGIAGAAVGGGAGGGLSTALISINRDAFGYFYQKEEAIMKEWWKLMEDHVIDSFNLFMEQLPMQVDRLTKPLKEEFFSLPNKINFLKSEAARMKSASFPPQTTATIPTFMSLNI